MKKEYLTEKTDTMEVRPEEGWRRVWIYSKTFVCNGRRSNLRDQRRDAVVEAINWACTGAQDNHDWVSEFSLVLHEKNILVRLDLYFEVLCIAHWGHMWYSGLTSLNNALVNEAGDEKKGH